MLLLFFSFTELAAAILKCLDTYMLSYMYYYEANKFRDGIISLSWYMYITLTCH